MRVTDAAEQVHSITQVLFWVFFFFNFFWLCIEFKLVKREEYGFMSYLMLIQYLHCKYLFNLKAAT